MPMQPAPQKTEFPHYLLTTNIWIKDTLDFLDRYLGPVKKPERTLPQFKDWLGLAEFVSDFGSEMS
ncbi:MAG: hypothetical protein AB1715_12300 [Acidobacteriota bacterium]